MKAKTAYYDLGAGYQWSPLRVGLVLRAPDGREVYCQPGDDETAMREVIDALGEHEPGSVRDTCAHVALSDYFA